MSTSSIEQDISFPSPKHQPRPYLACPNHVFSEIRIVCKIQDTKPCIMTQEYANHDIKSNVKKLDTSSATK